MNTKNHSFDVCIDTLSKMTNSRLVFLWDLYVSRCCVIVDSEAAVFFILSGEHSDVDNKNLCFSYFSTSESIHVSLVE
jgi:hypothetical protein